ncbi:hypothetical protein FACS189419_06170 [Planctomycetales bacterium]|nr:hypothetical protein FACS189419_06170 [Planctomycetales bacterium]
MKTFICQFVRFIAVICIVVLCCIAADAESRIDWATEAYKKNCEAVVNIQGDKIEEGTNKEPGKSYNGMGTGIVIDERGYIITNFHVVDGIKKIQVTTFDEKKYTAKLVGYDLGTDLAVIKIDARRPLKAITFGRSNDLMPGEVCLAIGNPYGYTFSVTNGRISGINREVDVNEKLVYRQAIQTNAEINPGNSGGPLININGEMIGINTAIRQGAAGIAFAIPIDQVVDVSAKLIKGIVEQYVLIGMDVSQEDTADYGDTRWFNIVVDNVDSNSPASAAGLRKGDLLTHIGSYTLKNKLDVYRALLDVQPNEDIAFTVKRDNESLDLSVAVSRSKRRSTNSSAYANVINRNEGTAPPKAAVISPKTASQRVSKEELDEIVWDKLGIRCVSMPLNEYRKQFPPYVKKFPYGGVKIEEVREGSRMKKGHISNGDVIVSIGDFVTASNSDVRYIATAWDSIKWDSTKTEDDEVITVNVFRDGQYYQTEISLR